MKTIKYSWVMGALLAFTTHVQAQFKNQKTETVKISGNCEMCENTIEKAARQKGLAKADWNKDTKMAVITYDSKKQTLDDILKRIAHAGYDNEKYLAPDEAYAKLPDCCKYERKNKKAIANSHASHQNNADGSKTNTIAATQPLSALFEAYFDLKNALVKSDSKTAAAKASDLLKAYEKVEMGKMKNDEHDAWMKEMDNIKKSAEQIAGSKDISVQRKKFSALSENMFVLAKVADLDYTVYQQHCPMYNDGEGANWLSKESEIKNPYYGSQMLTCGKTVETINVKK